MNRYILSCVIASISMVGAMPSCRSAEATELDRLAAIRTAVEMFCKAEFDGDSARYERAKLSGAYRAQKKRDDPLFEGERFSFIWDPIVVVSSYQVKAITVKGTTATAKVDYYRVGISRDGVIVEGPKEHDIVKLILISDGKQWWILDPPEPRVSLEAMIQFYSEWMLNFDEKWWAANPSEEQKQGYYKDKMAFDVLEDIKRKVRP